MHHILFDKSWIEGFGSMCHPIEFQLDRKGIIVVKGKNGAGKTTSFSALLWCIYKVNLKGIVNSKVPTWPKNRTAEWKGTRVMVSFSIPERGKDYLIARHINYKLKTVGTKGDSSLMIFEKEAGSGEFLPTHMLGDEQHKGDQQGYINELIGINSDAFLNSVLFGQRMKRLVEAKDEEKRELFETLFSMAFIEQARDKAKIKKANAEVTIKELSDKLDNLVVQHDQLATRIKYNDETLANHTQNKNIKLQAILDKRDTLVAEKQRLDVELLRLNEQKGLAGNPMAAYSQKMTEYNNLTTEYNNFSADLQYAIDGLKAQALQDQDLYIGKEENDKNNLECLIQGLNSEISEQNADLQRSTADLLEARDTAHKSFRVANDASVLDWTTKIKKQDEVIKTAFDFYKLDEIDIKRYKDHIQQTNDTLQRAQFDLKSVDKKCPNCDASVVPAAELQPMLDKYNGIIENCSKSLPAIELTLSQLSDKLPALLADAQKEDKIGLDFRVEYNKALIRKEQAEKAFTSDNDPNVQLIISAIDKKRKNLQQFADKVLEYRCGINQCLANIQEAQRQKQIIEAEKAYLRHHQILAGQDKSKAMYENLQRLYAEANELNRQIAALSIIQGDIDLRNNSLYHVTQQLIDKDAEWHTCSNEPDPKTDNDECITALNSIAPTREAYEAEHVKQLKTLDDLNFWINTGYAAKGLKSFMFDSGLRLLNESVQKYAARMGVTLQFSIDMEKANKPFVTKCYKGDMEIDYNEFSGGQKARLDVATAFAMHDVVSYSSNINILILDEIFENLDSEGIEIVFDLIRVKSGGEGRTVYVITHSSYIDTLNTKTIDIALDEQENSYIY